MSSFGVEYPAKGRIAGAIVLTACTTLAGCVLVADDLTRSPPQDGNGASSGGEGALGSGAGGSGVGGATGGASGGNGGDGGTGLFAPGRENCLNGVDDDDDGIIDCADDDCSDFAVIPALPGGWLGPVGLSNADPKGRVCNEFWGAPFLENYEAAIDGGAHACACTCATPTWGPCSWSIEMRDLTCSVADPNDFTISGTGNVACPPGNPQTPDISGVDAIRSFNLNVSTGTCQPVEDEMIDPVTFERRTACDAVGIGTAPDDSLCVPAPSAELDDVLCIYASGEHDCPLGPYSDRHQLAASHTDDRRCEGACQCAPATGGSCAGTISFRNSSCQQVSTAPLDGTCYSANGIFDRYAITMAGSGGTCQTSQSTYEAGNLLLNGAVTLCCGSLDKIQSEPTLEPGG